MKNMDTDEKTPVIWTFNAKRIVITYDDLKDYVQRKKIRNYRQYRLLWRFKRLPKHFPVNPNTHFGKDVYEGTNIFYDNFNARICTYEQAVDKVRKLGITSVSKYRHYVLNCQQDQLYERLPIHPRLCWPEQWVNFGVFLGTNTLSNSKKSRKFLPYEEALAFIHRLKLRNTYDWWEYAGSTKRPSYIPRNPWEVYKHKYKGMKVWLGVDLVSAAGIRENNTSAVLALFHITDNPSNVVNFAVFDGGRLEAYDECKNNKWKLLTMYIHEIHNVSAIMDIFRKYSSSVHDQQLTTTNYAQMKFELDMLLTIANI